MTDSYELSRDQYLSCIEKWSSLIKVSSVYEYSCLHLFLKSREYFLNYEYDYLQSLVGISHICFLMYSFLVIFISHPVLYKKNVKLYVIF